MADDNIDPRFDPAFQRGFEGTVGATRRRPPIGSPSVVPAQEAVARAVVVAPLERVAVPVQPVAQRTPAAPPERESGIEPDFDSGTDSGIEPRRGNPLVIALIVIAIVLIGAGIVGAQFATAAFQTNLTTSVSYVTVLLVISSSAVSVGLGVATLIGILFLYAARSLRR